MKELFRRFLIENPTIRFHIINFLREGIVENYYNTKFEKNCLLMYVLNPFVQKEVNNSHQAYWQELEMARLLREREYNIDVIDYNNTSIRLNKKYDLVIDLIPGKNPVFKKYMNPDCKTIAYLTGSNALFQNTAEKVRLENLKERRGVILKPRRQSPLLTKDIENYTACFMIGNEYNWKTYKEFKLNKPYFIKNTGHYQEYIFDLNKKKKNSFLYFGSMGQVHKGLDLLLEIFSKNHFPAELYVCGTFKDEEDFERCYKHELYECSNIHPIGFVNIDDDMFRNLTNVCVYSILPSCSEGIAGSVLTTMAAGVIPICSRECGFEDDEVIHLKNCKIETIQQIILEYMQKDDEWIISESKRVYDIVQQRYSRQNFIDSLSYAFDCVLKE